MEYHVWLILTGSFAGTTIALLICRAPLAAVAIMAALTMGFVTYGFSH